MTLFGKDMDELEVVAADFLPDGKKLYILVADADCNLYVLQYDPEGKEHISIFRLVDKRNTNTTIWNRSKILER
jgi:cleavage and polyadenylation specificity factor subunit 1